MTARVREVTAAATAAGSSVKRSGSMSAKTGRAPAIMMARALNAADSGVVITSSPAPMSRARSASASASVPVPTPIARAALTGRGELSLERLELGAEDEPAAHDHALDRLTDGRRIRTRPQIKERNHIVPTYCGRCSR